MENRFQKLREEYSEQRRDKDPTAKIYSQREMYEEMIKAGFKVSFAKIKKIESEQYGVEIDAETLRAYKWKFDVSADWLIDSSIETRKLTGSVASASKVTGLSDESIEMLMLWNKQRKEENKLIPALGKDIEVINILLEYQFALTKKVAPNYASWSVFHFIGQYLTPTKMEREQQDRLRVCSGTVWKDIEIGDTLEKADGTRYIVNNTEAINATSGSGSDTSKVHLTNNASNERYVVDINAMFKSYSKDNIFAVLDKIKDYMSKRK